MVQSKVKYLDILWHHRWFALTIFAVVLIVAFAASKLQQEVFSVKAGIYIEPKPSTVIGESAVMSADSEYTLINNQVEILGSDKVSAKAVAYIQAKLGNAFPVSEAGLERSLKISRKDYSNVINLEMTAPVKPKQLQTMMLEYLRAYQDALEQLNSDKSNREWQFLEKQLAAAKAELSEIANRIRDFEASNQTYDLDAQVSQMLQVASGLDEQVKFLNSDIQATAKEISAAGKLLSTSAEYVNLMSRLERDPESQELRKRMIALEAEKAEWSSKVTEAHPKIRVLNRELGHVKALLDQRLETFGTAFQQKKPIGSQPVITASPLDFTLAESIIKNQIKLDSLRAKAQALTGARTEVMAKLSGTPHQAVEYWSLKNNFDMAQEKVKVLQKRLDDAVLKREVSKNFTKVEILKHPDIPISPTKPNLMKNMISATLLGLLLALFAVFTRSSLDRIFRWPFQLKGLGIGSVFSLTPLPARKAFAATLERGNFVVPDAYKRLIVHLEDLARTEKVRRIGLIPVGTANDRSIPTVSLMLYLTEMANKVALIDTDFSKTSVSDLIGSLRLPVSAAIQAGPGLSDYLSGDTEDFVDIIYPLGKTVYGSFIPSGEPVQGANFSTLQRNLGHLEKELSPNYHFVFYSLPSIRQSYDAVAVSRMLDGVLLMIYPGSSSLDEIKQAIRELETAKVRLLGMILQPA